MNETGMDANTTAVVEAAQRLAMALLVSGNSEIEVGYVQRLGMDKHGEVSIRIKK